MTTEFKAKVGVNIDEATAKLTHFRKQLEALGRVVGPREARMHMRGLDQSLQPIARELRGITIPAMQAFGITTLSVTGGLFAAAVALNKFSKEAISLKYFSDATGFSTNKIREFNAVMGGLGIEQPQAALKKLSDTLFALKNNLGIDAETYAALKPEVWDKLKNSATSSNEALQIVLRSLAAVQDAGRREYLFQKIFGVSGGAAVKDYKLFNDALDKAGGLIKINDENARAFSVQMLVLNNRMDNLKVSFMNAFGGDGAKAMEEMMTFVEAHGPSISSIFKHWEITLTAIGAFLMRKEFIALIGLFSRLGVLTPVGLAAAGAGAGVALASSKEGPGYWAWEGLRNLLIGPRGGTMDRITGASSALDKYYLGGSLKQPATPWDDNTRPKANKQSWGEWFSNLFSMSAQGAESPMLKKDMDKEAIEKGTKTGVFEGMRDWYSMQELLAGGGGGGGGGGDNAQGIGGPRSGGNIDTPRGAGGQSSRMPENKREVAAIVADEWRKAGMSEAGIAGILANIRSESNFNPNLRHADQPRFSGEAHFAHGLYQEGGTEWNNYAAWLKKYYPTADWRDPRLQSRFAAERLKSAYRTTWEQMNKSSKEQAASAYVHGYLRPKWVYEQQRKAQYSRGVPGVDYYTKGALPPPEKSVATPPDSVLRVPGKQSQEKRFNDSLPPFSPNAFSNSGGWDNRRIDQALAAQTHKVEGSASLKVDVNAPKGTNVWADADGMFNKVELNRSQQMAPASDTFGGGGW